jgi:hypothetical protein
MDGGGVRAENLKAALQRVKDNKGSSGIDGMTVNGLADYLKQHWPVIREQLLSGTYVPKPVRRVEIPKPDGGIDGVTPQSGPKPQPNPTNEVEQHPRRLRLSYGLMN